MYVIRRKQSIKTHQKNENNINLSHIKTNSKKKMSAMHSFLSLLTPRESAWNIHNYTQRNSIHLDAEKNPINRGYWGLKNNYLQRIEAVIHLLFSHTPRI